MTDYNLGRVVGTDGVGIQSIASILEATGRTKVVITLTTGTTETFYIEKGTKGDTGTGIRKIELISTVGKDKNYRITFTDNTTFDYTITDGEDAVCDTDFDEDSENALENKVITGAINTINTTLEEKYDKNDVLQLLIDYGLVRTADTADSVVLAGDKEILSYANGDILTLSATVYDDDNNVVPNKKVVFYKNEVVMDTRYTDANGVATYEYTSEGAGDLRFEASVGELLSETYNVEDCIFAHTGEISYTSSNLQVSNALYELGNINDFDFIMEFDIKSNNTGGGLNIGASSQYTPPSNANYRMFIGTDTHQFNMNNRTTSSDHSNVGTVTDNVYYHMKLVKNGNSFTGYYGDNETVISTKNAVWINNYNSYDLYWMNWSGTNYVKNIKIKPL